MVVTLAAPAKEVHKFDHGLAFSELAHLGLLSRDDPIWHSLLRASLVLQICLDFHTLIGIPYYSLAIHYFLPYSHLCASSVYHMPPHDEIVGL